MFEIPPEQEQQLVDELASALERLVDTSCPDMAALWLAATRTGRSQLAQRFGRLDFEPSVKYLKLGKSSRSKYRSLSVWRHTALWQEALEQVSDRDFQRAVELVYFTPFPENRPPYAWTARGRDAPGVEAFANATTLKHQAKEGAAAILNLLRAKRRRWVRGSYLEELKAELMQPGLRSSVEDVLKLEEHDNLERA